MPAGLDVVVGGVGVGGVQRKTEFMKIKINMCLNIFKDCQK